jgi:cytochrome b561
MATHGDYDIETYSPAARVFHWLVALLIFIQIPFGFYMVDSEEEMEKLKEAGKAVNDNGLIDQMFSAHKLAGIAILLLVVVRLLYRFVHGTPVPDRTVPVALIGLSHLVHWLLYLLLIAVPVIGYIATSYYGGLDVFGIHLPAVTIKDQKFAETVFEWHEFAAVVLLGVAGAHIFGAIYHRFIRKDRVVERMLPKRTA